MAPIISPRIVYHYRFLPVKQEGNILFVLIESPENIELMDEISREVGMRVVGRKESETVILEGLKQQYGVGADTLELLGQSQDETSSSIQLDDIGSKDSDLEDQTSDASIVKFVNQIIREAFLDRATDIHIEPFEGKLRIRYRIDGMLVDVAVPPNIQQFQDSIISRVKIMANMNIAEKRLPQDGRIRMRMGVDDLDLRVSLLPISHGESVNIRILRRGTIMLGLEELGYATDDIHVIHRAIQEPHGIVLITGPTGSGKSTSLYACLSRLNTHDRKIITIEDPIEYEIEGLCQMQVIPKIGFTFSAGLRSILRHDPNIILVGEIRDFETAELAIRSSLTGHLVFSSLHTNDSAGAVARLLDLGLEPFLVASSLVCVVAQRLVRIICPDCKITVSGNEETRIQLGIDKEDWNQVQYYKGQGCQSCRNTGYRGRTVIYEILMTNEEIRELIIQRVSSGKIRQLAQQSGLISLRQNGWKKVVQGITTPEEILRVTQSDE